MTTWNGSKRRRTVEVPPGSFFDAPSRCWRCPPSTSDDELQELCRSLDAIVDGACDGCGAHGLVTACHHAHQTPSLEYRVEPVLLLCSACAPALFAQARSSLADA